MFVNLSAGTGFLVEQDGLGCIYPGLTTSVTDNVLIFMDSLHIFPSMATLVHMLPISHLKTSQFVVTLHS